jgi:hypothetical protein
MTTTFACSICGDPATEICVYCTKDACGNHRCAKCKRCSDCCECVLALDERVPAEPAAPVEERSPEAPAEAQVPAEEALPPDAHPQPAAGDFAARQEEQPGAEAYQPDNPEASEPEPTKDPPASKRDTLPEAVSS